MTLGLAPRIDNAAWALRSTVTGSITPIVADDQDEACQVQDATGRPHIYEILSGNPSSGGMLVVPAHEGDNRMGRGHANAQ
ncbi:MAG TPA: hypothetical protein VFC19_42400 [Candidatus Limnocylindrales bacterium]|nr:hypothetical protein [Candidatus Limnocylindrales bacterium]